MSHALTAQPAAFDTAMVRIEARRFLRHPLFVVGALAAYAVTWLVALSGPMPNDVLAWTVIPAFFIGLPSLIAASRLTRSADVATEAVTTAPSTEADRTLALAGACLVPLGAGLLWIVELFVALQVIGSPHPNELWLGTLSDLQVWAILIAGSPVACLGGALLGVLTGRWLRFPGSGIVAAVVVLLVVFIGQMPLSNSADSDVQRLRLWVPWAGFHSGSNTDGTATLYSGNAVFYLLYTLALCALAVVGAVWHDRTARSRRLKTVLWGTVAVAVAMLAAAVLTGPDTITSLPVPFKLDG